MKDRVGLCCDCTHAETIHSGKGSTFFLCALSKTDPKFPKYPRLPVVTCNGFVRTTEQHSPTTP
jgi:hypothetical protein